MWPGAVPGDPGCGWAVDARVIHIPGWGKDETAWLRTQSQVVGTGASRWVEAAPGDWGPGWRSDHGHASQHLLSVCFPVFCGCGLKLSGILLHNDEWVSDGMDGSRLLVGRLYHDRGLHTEGPGRGLV